MTYLESYLAKIWPFLLGVLLVSALCSCRYSQVVSGPDGRPEIAVVGEDQTGLQPDEVAGVPTEDIVGAAKDAVEHTDPVEIVKRGRSGDWFGVAAGVLGFVALFLSGLGVRRRIRNRKNKRG